MMKRYISEYVNQSHQLTVSVSQHYYVTKSGILKYQKKRLETTLANLSQSSKTNIIYYLVRDHYSGVFYAEITTSDKLLSPLGFLYRAWNDKEGFLFKGMPNRISLPNTVKKFLPELEQEILQAGVGVIDIKSGFEGGIGDVKNIDGYISYHIGDDISVLPDAIKHICSINEKRKLRNTVHTKAECWNIAVREIKTPTIELASY